MSNKMWDIFFTKKAQKQINALDKTIQSKFKKVIAEKLKTNPALYLEPLLGDMAGYYKFRIGDYRLICEKEEQKLIIIVIEIGHRKEIYK